MSRRNVIGFFVLVAFAAAFQVYFVVRKFPEIEPTPNARVAEFKKIGPYRIGISLGHHGAVLVRIPRDYSVTFRTLPADVRAEIAQHFQRLPILFALEYLLYLAVLSAVWFGLTRIWFTRRRHLVRAILAGLLVALGVFALQAPILWNYGGSAFSTWAGPGARSFSFPSMRITWVAGMTIAQRFVFEALQVGAWKFIEPVARLLTYIDIWLAPPRNILAAISIPSAVYGVVTAFVVLFISVVTRKVAMAAPN